MSSQIIAKADFAEGPTNFLMIFIFDLNFGHVNILKTDVYQIFKTSICQRIII
jgi:hypothetical protein